MGSGVPSLDLWPKLRRRVKDCKTRKVKSKFNSYASQGLEKLSVVYAELQCRRDSMVERIGAPASMVRCMSRSCSRSVLPNNSQIAIDVAVASNYHCEDTVSSASGSEVFFGAVVSKSYTEDATGQSLVRNADIVRQGRDSVTSELVDSAEETIGLDKSVEVEAEDVELVFEREISLKDGFGGLELRGRKCSRSRRRPLCGRERRWRQVNRTAVTFIVILGIMAEKSANLAGSILAALLLGVVSPCRRGRQHLCRLLSDIVHHLQGHLHAYLSGLASKRLVFDLSHAEDKNECITESSSPCLTTPRRNSSYFPPVCSAEASHSPQMSAASNDLASDVEAPRSREASSRPISPSISPVSNMRSPTAHVPTLRCLSPSNKLNQFKTKMLKSFSSNKSASDFRPQRAGSMPPISTGGENYQESLGSQSERRSSNSATVVEDIGLRSISPPDRVMKKKSFLQRRSMLRNENEGSDASDIRTSSFSRSRFGNLRISISHSHDDFGTTSPAPDSSRSLRIGSLRISTSMKESPRKSVDLCSKRPCSPVEWKQRANTSTMEGSRTEHVTPRQSGLRSASPFPAGLGVRDMKKRHKYEAFLVVVFLVALLFLIAGRAPAVVATSVSLMFLSQLDKFQQSGGAGWDTDASRRTVSISRKLRTSESTYFSPGTASPHTPCTPCRGGAYSTTTPTSISNECRRSICMGQFFGRSKSS